MLPIFNYMMHHGQVALEEMFGTFNMSIGFIVVVDASDVNDTLTLLRDQGETVSVIGTVVKGSKEVELCNG